MEKVAAITKQTAELGFKFNGVEVIGQDKLGNFEIQDLMSRYNQAERLASAIMAKLCSTYVGMVGKI